MARATSTKYGDVVVSKSDLHKPFNEKEPVFILRAQDSLAMATIRNYANLCASAGLEEHARSVEDSLHAFLAWQQANPGKVKSPDTYVPTEEKEMN